MKDLYPGIQVFPSSVFHPHWRESLHTPYFCTTVLPTFGETHPFMRMGCQSLRMNPWTCHRALGFAPCSLKPTNQITKRGNKQWFFQEPPFRGPCLFGFTFGLWRSKPLPYFQQPWKTETAWSRRAPGCIGLAPFLGQPCFLFCLGYYPCLPRKLAFRKKNAIPTR